MNATTPARKTGHTRTDSLQGPVANGVVATAAGSVSSPAAVPSGTAPAILFIEFTRRCRAIQAGTLALACRLVAAETEPQVLTQTLDIESRPGVVAAIRVRLLALGGNAAYRPGILKGAQS